MTDAEQILLDLYRARRARVNAKEAMRAKAEALGQCDGRNYPEAGPCYEKYPDDKTEWCEVCIEKLPVWEEWRRVSARAGAALRKATRFGESLAKGGDADG